MRRNSVSIIPAGLLFPIGTIILGITMFVARPIHRGIGALLSIGGVLFPIGRTAGHEWAVVSCDLVLAATFALIGWQILTRPEVWGAEVTVPPEARAIHDGGLSVMN
jgi:protein-S-isoprenylcysteine O-methyltransferase Ste14